MAKIEKNNSRSSTTMIQRYLGLKDVSGSILCISLHLRTYTIDSLHHHCFIIFLLHHNHLIVTSSFPFIISSSVIFLPKSSSSYFFGWLFLCQLTVPYQLCFIILFLSCFSVRLYHCLLVFSSSSMVFTQSNLIFVFFISSSISHHHCLHQSVYSMSKP